MSLISDIIHFNRGFVSQREFAEFKTTKYPDKKMVILTCMDTRLIELLPRAMNIRNGDAKIIKSAGAMISHPFGSIMRSILVAVYELDAKEVCVIGHYDCGMTDLHATHIIEKAKERGIPQERIDTLYKAGIDLDHWLTGFRNVKEAITNSVDMIKHHPLMPTNIAVHGLLIHPETGGLEIVIDGYQKIGA